MWVGLVVDDVVRKRLELILLLTYKNYFRLKL